MGDERRRRRWRSSKLARRIMAINAIALAILVGGVLYLDQFRQSLIDSRVVELRIAGEIIAGALSEAATEGPEAENIELHQAEQILARLVVPAEIRARLFSMEGKLLLDSRDLAVGELIVTRKLPPVGTAKAYWKVIARNFHAAVDLIAAKQRLTLYNEEILQTAADYPEVLAALDGDSEAMLRATAHGPIIITVAVPVQRLRRVLGVLLLSKDTADIDHIVRRERVEILKIFGISLAITLLLSFFLSKTIARPIRLLAEAADSVRPGRGRQVKIPDFGHRRDEIGDLSIALQDMTQALFRQLDAVEAFAADVSHELKNPLTSMRSALETLERTADEDKRQQLLSIVADDVGRLNRLITEISAASRLDAQMSRARMERVDLGELVHTMIEVYHATAKPGVARVRLEVAERGPITVRGLEDPLGQVIRNLLENALSFSPPDGEVVLSLRRAGSMAELTVEDQGPGIPLDKLETIFDRFYSERPAGEIFGKHSGLGLHICKRIVEAHQGQIFAENRAVPAEGDDSAPEGARFVVRLPLAV